MPSFKPQNPLLKAAFVLTLMSPFATPAIAGELYKGKWNGKYKSQIEILTTDPLTVKYCFNREPCTNNRPKGSLKKMIFAWPKNGNFPGADMVLQKVGNAYQGTYQQTGSTQISTIVFKRKK